jgi:hypothetical protein
MMTQERTPAQIDAANRYAAYQQGWSHGATMRAYAVAVRDHRNAGIRDAYRKGYTDGGVARDRALAMASEEYGHTPSILRSES